ncbi:hypothetical protein NDN08_005316 [Rhodosorus marinus]|uniref:Zinc/iron permease n=1 Tax=Rhodosorus marinus TaxID=101924 RepID=A0AAV8V3M8_9RHOD|nr:hypothetical protein NDN08_005316 [Rhodosorus marinus]
MAVDERMSAFELITVHQSDGCDSTCVSWKIGFLFIILTGGLVGGLAPLLFSGKGTRTKIISQALLLCSGGVLLAISIVHMMEDAIENLLPFQEDSWSGYPYAFTILMLGFLLDHFIESVGGYYFGKYLQERAMGDKGASDEKVIDGSGSVGDEDLEVGLPSDSETSLGEQKTVKKSKEIYFAIAASAGYFGLSVHSVLAGLTLGLGDWETALSMFVAIISHKIFAAFAVASNLLKANPPRWIYFTIIVCFSLTTPVSIGIGMGITSLVGDVAKGTLLALAAGMLLYVGTVHTLEHAAKGDVHLSPIWAYLSYLSGAALMVVVISIVTFTIGGG